MDQEKQQSLQKIFGQCVREIRQSRGLTQMQLAVKAETDVRQVQRIEAGKIATSITQAYLIAQALEVTLDELLR